MFHIVFNATENYIAYAAVLINSIIDKALQKNSNKADRDQEFTFHIITDYISSNYKEKIKKLENELSNKIPIKISIHLMSGDEFAGLKNYGSKIIYFRLNLEKFLPVNIDRCLYLDVDMIVLKDIRPLFSINLQGKLGAVVCDMGSKKHKLTTKNKNYDDIDLGNYYFNSGLLLLNLQQWRKEQVTEKCSFLIKNYTPHTPDQDILNAVMPLSKIQILPFSWNCVTNAFCFAICKDDHPGYLPYSRKELKDSLDNPCILHYSLMFSDNKKPTRTVNKKPTTTVNKECGHLMGSVA